MAIRHAPDEYGHEGSIPDSTSVDGSGASPMQVRASPEDFGAQVGGAIKGLGATTEDIAKQYGKIANETLMTDADANYAMRSAKIKSDFQQLTGMEAFNALPKARADMQAAWQESGQNLPLGAQHGYDMLTARTNANHIGDMSSWATNQLKQARIDSYSNMQNVNMQALTDPSTAMNPDRAQYHIDSIIYGEQAKLDESHPGLKTDPNTGVISFDESKPEGTQLKTQLQQNIDSRISQAQMTRFNTLAKPDVMGVLPAFDLYQQNRDTMPRQAQVALDASFAPKVFQAHKDNAVGSTLSDAVQSHAQMLYNPDSSKTAIDTVLKNEGGLSPDGHAIYGIDKDAHPAEFAEAQKIASDKGNAAGQEYAKQFYKTEYWDKKGVADLPANTQTVVMDGVVNHSAAFSDKLIQAAKDGASPTQLIDMRRAEYQRLADTNPAKYGENLAGWNNRLDNLQTGLAMEGKPKSYGANPDGSPLTQADYFRTHSMDVLAKGDVYAEQTMPGSLEFKRAVRESLNNYMSKTISNQSAQYMMDNKNVMRAINGELTKGNPPETEEELRQIPGMGALLDKVAVQDPKFAEGIPTTLAKVARRNAVTNSANGYETVLRTLEPHGSENPNAISSQDHLDRALGRSDGTGINMKDYNDAKPALELKDEMKEAISKNMKDIANANGNLDGKGQQRAMQWYNQTMTAWKQNDAMGDKGLTAADFASKIGEKDGPPMPEPPSRMQQILNWAKDFRKPQDEVPVFSAPTDPGFAKLPSGAQFKTSDGQIRTKK